MCEEDCNCSGRPRNPLVIEASQDDMKIQVHLEEDYTAEQLVEAFKRIYIALGKSIRTIDEYFN